MTSVLEKQKIVKWLLIISLILMSFLLKPVKSDAAEPIASVNVRTDGHVTSVYLSNNPFAVAYLRGSDGQLYFCLDFALSYPTSAGLPYSPSESYPRPEITWLLDNFYTHKTIFGDETLDTQYVMTQIAIWILDEPNDVPDTTLLLQSNPKLKQLVDKAREYANLPSIEVAMDAVTATTTITATQSPDAAGTQDYKATINVSVNNLSNDTITKEIVSGQLYMITGSTRIPIVSNENISYTFDKATGQGMITVDGQYYNQLAADTQFEFVADIELTTTDSHFLAYRTPDTKYQSLGTAYKVKLERDFSTSGKIGISHVINIQGLKVWNDDNNRDGIRPESVIIHLLANGSKVTELVVSAENNWEFVFPNVPKTRDGAAITYTLEEILAEGYTSTINGYTITNAHDIETIGFVIVKDWQDEDDLQGIRPNSVVIQVLANGEVVEEVTLDDSNDWMHVFEDLPKNFEGEPIEYTVAEKDASEGYVTSIAGNMVDGFVITNELVPTEDPDDGGVDDDFDDNDSGKDDDKDIPNKEPNTTSGLPQTGGEMNTTLPLIGAILLLLAALFQRYRRKEFFEGLSLAQDDIIFSENRFIKKVKSIVRKV